MDYAGFALNVVSYVENLPESVSELRKRDDWPLRKQAMQEEMDSLSKNETWTLAKPPEGRSAVTCKCVFKVKQSDENEEAELIELCAAACHGQWLIRILQDLGFKSVGPITYHEDNQSTIKIVSNPKDSRRLSFWMFRIFRSGAVGD